MKVFYESDSTVVTEKILDHNGSVFQINQITDMNITDDSYLVNARFREEKKSKTSKFIWGGILILLGLLFNDVDFLMWPLLIIGAILLLIGFSMNPKLQETTYTLHLSFSNGKELNIYGDKTPIIQLRDAIAQAMHIH